MNKVTHCPQCHFQYTKSNNKYCNDAEPEVEKVQQET